MVQRFLTLGVHHILTGADHLLFLVGLLLLGGGVRQLLIVVTAFTLAHSVTLSLSALDLFSPPANIVEPAICPQHRMGRGPTTCWLVEAETCVPGSPLYSA